MNEKSNKIEFSFKSAFYSFLFLGLIAYLASKAIFFSKRNNALQSHAIKTLAFVIGKKNYYGNRPVSQEFSYSYRFEVNGHNYEGDTRDPSLQVGDSLLVKYSPENPEYNLPVSE